MHVLLISATDFEIRKTIQWLDSKSFTLNDLKPELLITGIGQLQTAYSLQKKISSGRPDLIIQAGIAGSSSSGDLNHIFAVQSEMQSDFGVLENTGFRSVYDLGFAPPDQFPFRNGKLLNKYRELLAWSGLPLIDGTTVNEIKSSDFRGFKQNDDRIVESMEGAAFHFVCLNEEIPFLQIRSVSNKIGARDKSHWNITGSIELLNDTIISLIHKLQLTDDVIFRI
jgi:futalosine hydrolase